MNVWAHMKYFEIILAVHRIVAIDLEARAEEHHMQEREVRLARRERERVRCTALSIRNG